MSSRCVNTIIITTVVTDAGGYVPGLHHEFTPPCCMWCRDGVRPRKQAQQEEQEREQEQGDAADDVSAGSCAWDPDMEGLTYEHMQGLQLVETASENTWSGQNECPGAPPLPGGLDVQETAWAAQDARLPSWEDPGFMNYTDAWGRAYPFPRPPMATGGPSFLAAFDVREEACSIMSLDETPPPSEAMTSNPAEENAGGEAHRCAPPDVVAVTEQFANLGRSHHSAGAAAQHESRSNIEEASSCTVTPLHDARHNDQPRLPPSPPSSDRPVAAAVPAHACPDGQHATSTQRQRRRLRTRAYGPDAYVLTKRTRKSHRGLAKSRHGRTKTPVRTRWTSWDGFAD
ncbi:hypothetical protein E4U53_005954 [Claviceps sorghi]|nr:hypothetical protein E4U53_005954 [Claviceps sorghi]